MLHYFQIEFASQFKCVGFLIRLCHYFVIKSAETGAVVNLVTELRACEPIHLLLCSIIVIELADIELDIDRLIFCETESRVCQDKRRIFFDDYDRVKCLILMHQGHWESQRALQVEELSERLRIL